jgi:hypothetical protein
MRGNLCDIVTFAVTVFITIRMHNHSLFFEVVSLQNVLKVADDISLCQYSVFEVMTGDERLRSVPIIAHE